MRDRKHCLVPMLVTLVTFWFLPGCMLEFSGTIEVDGGVDGGGTSDQDKPCEDECYQGDRVCEGVGFKVCGQYDADSCVEWSKPMECQQGQSGVDGMCGQGCTDLCVAGTRQCVGNSYQVCSDTNNDSCFEWGGQVACEAGLICDQGECLSNCADLCTTGSRRCVGNAYETCGDYDADGCSEWGGQTPCSSGLTCDEGQCAETCVNACQAGEKRCAGAGFFEVCGNYDADSCMDWGGQTACSTGQVCNLGACESTCSDECTAGTRRCVGNAYEVCGNYDSDNCQEWGSYTACGASEICNQGYCDSTCTDECTTGQQRCVAGVEAYETCGEYDGDSCSEWGGQVNCQADEICDQASATCEGQSNEYPPGPYGKAMGSTFANECFEECQCNGANPSDSRPFCLEEYVGDPAIMVTIHAGW